MDETTTEKTLEDAGSDASREQAAIHRPTRPADECHELKLSNGATVATIGQEIKSHLEEMLKFKMRSDDVTVITYPKSGTTWVQEIVWLLCNDGNTEAAKAESLFQRFGLLDMPETPLFAVFRGLTSLDEWPTSKRRFIKTHWCFQAQPLDQQIKTHGKIVYVVRNPKDVCVSFYHMHRMMPSIPEPGAWNEFLDKFIRGKVVYGSWFDHVLQYWQVYQERKDSMYVVSYEDLKKDLKEEVIKLSKFLDKELSAEKIDAIVQHCSFKEMSVNENTNWSEYDKYGVMDFKVSKFMRKGEVGDWKNYFTVSQSEAFDEVLKKRFQECDLKFEYELPPKNNN